MILDFLDWLSNFFAACAVLVLVLMVYYLGAGFYDWVISSFMKRRRADIHFQKTERYRSEFR